MGMDLSSINLISLQSKYMQKDKTIKALCAALQPIFKELSDEVKVCIIYANLSNLSGSILDELAHDMNITWYDATASEVIKKDLIKNALKVHQLRGTVYAVEQVTSTYFGDAKVEEWFEYGGQPYNFKVIAYNKEISNEKQQQYLRDLDSVKNCRSYLEEIVIGITCNDNVYCDDILIII